MPLSQRRAALIRRLRTRKTREREGLVLVEGVRAVGEALDAGVGLRLVVVSSRLDATPEGSQLRARLTEAGIEVDEVTNAELGELSDTRHPQGVLLVCAEPTATFRISAEGRYLVLDAVQDPGNAGTLIRAATAFGLDGVIALDGTVDLWSAKAVRASAGMAFRMPIQSMSAGALVERVSAGDVELLVADMRGPSVPDRSTGGWLLVVGNEGSGPRPEVLAAAATKVSVPMPGPAESLNVGMAGAILLYALTSSTRETIVGG